MQRTHVTRIRDAARIFDEQIADERGRLDALAERPDPEGALVEAQDAAARILRATREMLRTLGAHG